jgi:hypothetical protein
MTRFPTFLSSLAVPAFVLAAACGSIDRMSLGSDESAVETCATTACGPQLGMPNETCADGSTSGPTGRCVRRRGESSCSWEVKKCAVVSDAGAAACGDECGPPLSVEEKVCADGRVIPGARCLRDTAGKCGWKLSTESCPAVDAGPATCSADRCGPPPAIAPTPCPDGSTIGPPIDCRAKADGTCGWVIGKTPECPTADAGPGPNDCNPSLCGPAPGAPACTCSDGSIGCNTGRCITNDSGCGWEWRDCPK